MNQLLQDPTRPRRGFPFPASTDAPCSVDPEQSEKPLSPMMFVHVRSAPGVRFCATSDPLRPPPNVRNHAAGAGIRTPGAPATVHQHAIFPRTHTETPAFPLDLEALDSGSVGVLAVGAPARGSSPGSWCWRLETDSGTGGRTRSQVPSLRRCRVSPTTGETTGPGGSLPDQFWLFPIRRTSRRHRGSCEGRSTGRRTR